MEEPLEGHLVVLHVVVGPGHPVVVPFILPVLYSAPSSYSAPSTYSAPSYSSTSYTPSSYATAAEPSDYFSYVPPAPTPTPYVDYSKMFPEPVYKKPDYTTHYDKPIPKSTTYEGVTKGKFRYRSKSPTRKKGEYGQNDPKKNITWLEHMVETGYFGNNKICLATANISYDVINRSLTKYGNNEAVFWSMVDCPYGVVIVPIVAVFKKGEPTHANMLIVNKTGPEWQIERFEPHGQVSASTSYGEGDLLADMQERIDEDLKKWFQKILNPIKQKFTYRRPVDVCPRRGPQTRSEEFESLGGFCQTWTLFYVDMKLTHPELSSDELLQILFDLDPKELYEMIQDYVQFVKDTQVPGEFYEYMISKMMMVLRYESAVEEMRKSSKYTDAEKDEISHELYRLIAKAPVDRDTVDTLIENFYYIMKIITENEIPGKSYENYALPVIKALQGKYLKKKQALSEALSKYLMASQFYPELAQGYLADLLKSIQ